MKVVFLFLFGERGTIFHGSWMKKKWSLAGQTLKKTNYKEESAKLRSLHEWVIGYQQFKKKKGKDRSEIYLETFNLILQMSRLWFSCVQGRWVPLLLSEKQVEKLGS